MGLAAAVLSMPVPLLLRSRRRLPVPLMAVTGTVHVMPLSALDGVPIVPVAVPVVVSAKSVPSTPLTASLKVTAKLMLVALADGVPCGAIDATEGPPGVALATTLPRKSPQIQEE